MKKVLIGLLVLSSLTFAKGWERVSVRPHDGGISRVYRYHNYKVKTWTVGSTTYTQMYSGKRLVVDRVETLNKRGLPTVTHYVEAKRPTDIVAYTTFLRTAGYKTHQPPKRRKR